MRNVLYETSADEWALISPFLICLGGVVLYVLVGVIEDCRSWLKQWRKGSQLNRRVPRR